MARLIRQRLAYLDRLPARHARIPISKKTVDGIGQKHIRTVEDKRYFAYRSIANRCEIIMDGLATGVRTEYGYHNIGWINKKFYYFALTIEMTMFVFANGTYMDNDRHSLLQEIGDVA